MSLKGYPFGFLASVIIAIATIEILDIPFNLRINIAFILATITFFLFNVMMESSDRTFQFNFSTKLEVLAVAVSFAVTSILLIGVPALGSELQYIPWNYVPVNSAFRSIVTFLFESIFPGYIVLRVIDKDRRISGWTLVIFSLVISILFISLLGLALVIFHLPLNELGPYLFIIVNTILMISYILTAFKRDYFHEKKIVAFNRIQLYENLALISMIILQVVFCCSLLALNFPLPPYDEWKRHGYSAYFSRGLFPSILYPWFLHVYFAFTYALSGIPSINTHQVLLSITVMPIIAFYAILKSFFKKRHRKIPILATFFGYFGGFGWICFLLLRQQGFSLYSALWEASQKTYTIAFTPVFYLAPYTSPAQFAGLVSFLLLIYLSFNQELSGWLRGFLSFVVVTYGYLGHIVEIPIFLLLLLTSIFIFERKLCARFKTVGISTLLSLLMTPLIEVFAQKGVQIYIGWHWYASIFLSILSVLAAYFKGRSRRPMSLKSFASSIFYREVPKKAVLLSLVYVYFLSFIVWGSIRNVFEVTSTFARANVFWSLFGLGVPSASFVPWYIYPLQLGFLGFLCIVAFVYILAKKKNAKDLEFFIVIVLFALILGRGTRLLPVYWEERFLTQLWVGLTVLAAFIFIKFVAYIRSCKIGGKRKKMFIALMLSSVIICGAADSLLYVEYLTHGYAAPGFKLSENELEALTSLRNDYVPDASVLTMTQISRLALLGFGGVGGDEQTLSPCGYEPYVSEYFSPKHPETVFYTLRNTSVLYAFLAKRDVDVLPRYTNSFMANYLVPYLPILVENDEATIYKVPTFNPPTYSAKDAVILPQFFYSDPKYPLRYEVGWKDDSFTSGWCTNENTTFSSDGDIAVVKTGFSIVNHDFYRSINISVNACPYVAIRWKTESSDLYLYLESEQNTSRYIYLGSSEEWTTTYIDLYNHYADETKSYTGLNENETLSLMRLRTLGENTQYYIDYIAFTRFDPNFMKNLALEMIASSAASYSLYIDSDKNCLDKQSIVLVWDPNETNDSYRLLNGISDWVEAGGNLTVFNTFGLGSFALNLSLATDEKAVIVDGISGPGGSFSIPQIAVYNLHSTDERVTTIGFFTQNSNVVGGLAFRKKMGDGQITYVDINLYLTALQQYDISKRKALFEKLEFIPKALGIFDRETSDLQIKPNQGLDFAHGEVEMEGKVCFQSNFLLPVYPKVLHVESLEAFNASGRIRFENVDVEDIDFLGSVDVTISAFNCKLNSVGYGGYVEVALKGDINVSMVASKDSYVLLSIRSNSSKLICGEVVNLKTSSPTPIKLLLHHPNVFVRGLTYFAKSLIHSRPYVRISDFFPMSIQGDVSFRIEYSDVIIILKNFQYNGRVEVFYPEWAKIRWNEMNIPWNEVLFSWQHIALIVLIGIVTITMIFRKIRRRLRRI